MEGSAEGVSYSEGDDGKAEVELLNSSDWDYDAYLGLIKGWLDKSTTGKDRDRVRNLLTACVRVTQKADSNSNITSIQKEGEGSEGNTTGKVVKNGVTANQPHPLEIDLILREMLGYLPVNTLLTCRLVNHTWNSYATSFLPKKKRKRVDVKVDQFLRFWTDFENVEVLPFTKLGLTLHNVSLEVISKFFTKYGSQIHDLKIQEVASQQFRYSEKMFLEDIRKLKFILRHVPNLKTLSLNLSEIFHKIMKYSQLGFKDPELLKIALTQVESFEFVTSVLLSEDILTGLFAMLPNVKVACLSMGACFKNYELLGEALQKLTLREIFVSSTYYSRNPLWNSIAGSQKLKVISFELLDPALGLRYAQVGNMLSSQSECLETLILTRQTGFRVSNNDTDENDDPRLRLPILNNLKCLEFHVENAVEYSHFAPLPVVPIRPEQVPALETVVISAILYQQRAFADSTFPTVRELRARGRGRDRRGNWEILIRISTLFPNLRKVTNLISTLDPHAISSIARVFENVEELEWEILGDVDEKNDFNCFISGLPMDSEWLLSQLTERFGTEAILSSIESPSASLRDFKRLTSLKLKFNGNGAVDEFCIDEIGVYLFLRLSPQLCLTLEGDFTIQSDLAAKLTAHFKKSYFCPRPKDDPNSYQRGVPI